MREKWQAEELAAYIRADQQWLVLGIVPVQAEWQRNTWTVRAMHRPTGGEYTFADRFQFDEQRVRALLPPFTSSGQTDH